MCFRKIILMARIEHQCLLAFYHLLKALWRKSNRATLQYCIEATVACFIQHGIFSKVLRRRRQACSYFFNKLFLRHVCAQRIIGFLLIAKVTPGIGTQVLTTS